MPARGRGDDTQCSKNIKSHSPPREALIWINGRLRAEVATDLSPNIPTYRLTRRCRQLHFPMLYTSGIVAAVTVGFVIWFTIVVTALRSAL